MEYTTATVLITVTPFEKNYCAFSRFKLRCLVFSFFFFPTMSLFKTLLSQSTLLLYLFLSLYFTLLEVEISVSVYNSLALGFVFILKFVFNF